MGRLIRKINMDIAGRFVSPVAGGGLNTIQRARIGFLEAWVSIIGNVVLFLVKYLAGIRIGSIALVADAFHTLTDVISSVIVIFGFKLANAQADQKHPYGHGRAEHVATLVIAVLIILTGLEFFTTGVRRFLHPEAVMGNWAVVGLMAFSTLVKEWMARFSEDLGEHIDSAALKADAWHHRSDAIASFFVGIALIASMFGFYRVDAVFGIIIAGLLVYTGIGFLHSAGSVLIGEGPSREKTEDCCRLAREINGVVDVHDVEMHSYGYHEVISLHIAVPSVLDVAAGHEIADRVEKHLGERMNAQVTVHVDPA